jgi:predicted phosphodiesterase
MFVLTVLTAFTLTTPPVMRDFAREIIKAPPDGSVSLVLIGDTGEPGPLVPRWTEAIRKEPASGVFVLGDLVYPQVPPCPTGRPDRAAVDILESHLAGPFRAIAKPTYLLIGNHDVSWGDDAPRERCVLAHFERDPLIRIPDLYYAVDAGPAHIVVLHTMGLEGELGAAQGAFAKTHLVKARASGKRVVFMGHHVLRTYRDKDGEDYVRPWLKAHDLRPDLWVNGHAHILQIGVYDGIPALTSGSASRPRVRAECDARRQAQACGEGEIWGVSTPGYVVLDLRPKRMGATEMTLTFKDADGLSLFAWDVPLPETSPSSPRGSR